MSTEVRPLRIVEMRAENVKRLRAVHITPKGDVVEIAGRNGQGKTSVLDAIALALEGKAVDVTAPVTRGQEKGSVTIDLGEYVVTRRWTQGGEASTLRVQAKVGDGLATMDKPQAVLDSLVGRVAFDPLRFARMSPKERREELLRLVPVGVDLDDLARRRAKTYEARTDAGRRLKSLQAQVDATQPIDGGAEQETSIAALAEEMRRVQESNRETDRLAGEAKRADVELVAARALVARLERELEDAKARVNGATTSLRLAQQMLDGRDVLSLETVQRQMEQAEATNRGVRDRNAARSRRDELLMQLDAADAEHAKLAQAIADIDATKAEALAAAEMPIDGLSLGEEDVTLRGVPFGDLAASEKIKVGLALAMSANPRLRVALVRDGSLLDDESMQVLAAWAEAEDAQVWREVVGDGGDGAIVIEDGHVVGAEVAAVGGE